MMFVVVFFVKQKTAYEMRISDWSSDVCSSDLVKLGHTTKLAYVDQSRDALDPKNNVWQEVSGGSDILTIGNFEIQSRAYIGRFNFKGTDQQKIVGSLSGGERGRLHMAKTLLQGGNVLQIGRAHV